MGIVHGQNERVVNMALYNDLNRDKNYELLYDDLCATCPYAFVCHDSCTECDMFMDRLEEMERGYELCLKR